MKRIFTAILSLAMVSASFVGCNEVTPEAVEKTLGSTTLAVSGVNATEVFTYGMTKTYSLEQVVNEAKVNAPEGWTATYEAEDNILTVVAPTSGGAKTGTITIKGFDRLEREATATMKVLVREKDAVEFADVAFRNYLAENFAGEDGVLSTEELAAITKVDIRGKEMAPNFRYEGMGITSLEGIEQLTGLTELYISNNNVASVDLSKNTKLTKLHAYFCGLSALDLKANTELTEVLVFYNNIEKLDLSKNTKLTTVYCQNNALTEVTFAANSKITDLNVAYNQLSAIDAAAYASATTLNVSNNQLAALDVTAATALTELNAENNILAEIDLSKAAKLTSLNLTQNALTELNLNGCSALVELNVAKNALTSVDLGGCPALESANISENAVETLVMNNLSKLTYLGCWNNKLAALDLAQCPNLERLLAYNNSIADINLSPVKKVSYVKIQNNPFVSINLNGCEALEYFLVAESTDNFGEGNIRYVRNNKGAIIGGRRFFLTGMKTTTSLSLDLNNVTDVDPSNFKKGAATTIAGLEIFGNSKLAELDVTKFTQMTYLDAKNNALTAIDVKANTELDTLYVNGNKIEAVDVAGLSKLSLLDVSGMQTLTSLNLEGITKTLANLYIVSSKDNALDWKGKGKFTLQTSSLKALDLNLKGASIATLSINGNEKLMSLNLANCPQVTTLQVQNNPLISTLDLSALTALDQLYANGNDLTEINLSNNTALATVNLSSNRIASVDLSTLASLNNLNISSNYVSVLDLVANAKLATLDCSNNFNLTNIYLAADSKAKVTKDEKAVITYGEGE